MRALWGAARCSRVNSGQRFHGGFDRGALMESRLVAELVIHFAFAGLGFQAFEPQTASLGES